ncbi:MAG: hypothetical protein ACYC2K_01905 [Gemmatimonadales bacterium]
MTDNAPASVSPTEPTATPVGLVFGSLAIAVLIGIGITAIVSFVVRTLQIQTPPPAAPDAQAALTNALASGPIQVLFMGVLLACLVAAIAAWRLTAATRDPFRRGVVGIMAALGTFAAGFAATVLADQVALALAPPSPDGLPSRIGFAALAVVAFAAATLLRSRRRPGRVR